ncbi:hypothetical protein GGX14DRAFT_355930 [Mycena pura]|uniref:Blue (type 1) copper domain-containing protein n=1 Tax=Mycena pura TaxID=153505 RepID=A0AAD6YK96_9AGAR|nr:hypothetical protein GGX14DRAFT_355930 [Mycena pura]
MLFAAGFALLFSSLAAAQDYGGGPAPATTTTAGAPPVPSAPANSTGHVNVDVAANGKFVFNPNNFNASAGTVVTFFFPNAGLNHSVTQSSFADPCTHLAATANTSAGFDSGLTAGVQFSINITDDTKPIWFHCKQVTHCGLGMVGSINAPATGNNTFANFMSAALAIGTAEPTETDNGPVLSGVNAIATAAPSNTAGAAPPKSGSAMRVGTSIAAVLLGGAAVIAML